ncbi:hypothetical protein [Streptomyces sp. NPDC051572]|uniref:hypothetical protein n=1 Tax=Streptomyces sp. NPDC051572 TaxID=3155802 RepID=UPI0034508160
MRAARKAARYKMADVGYCGAPHVSNVENSHEPPSYEMVEFYVTKFGADADVLWSAFYAMRRESKAQKRARIKRAQQERQGVHSLVVRQRGETHWIDSHGVTNEIGVSLEVSSAQRALKVSHAYPADPSPGTVMINAGMGCEITRIEESSRGLVAAFLDLGDEQPDSPSQSFSYKVHINSTVPAVPNIRYHALRTTERYTLQVQFTSPRLPRQVWWFRGESAEEAERDPEKKNILPPCAYNDYWRNFTDLDGEFCGLAWDW